MTSVLIVEDDPMTRLAVSEMLEVCGIEDVRSASNGLIAIDRLKEAQPELMLLDLMMPEMDGFELLRELRSGSAPRPRRIIVMSAHANSEDRENVKELGADQFLAKPFTLAQFEAAIAEPSE